LFFKEIEILVFISDVGIFILFLVVNLSNIVLRYRRTDLTRPWRAPLNIGGMPLISLLGAISCILMLIIINHPVQIGDIQFSSLLLGLVIFSLAIPLYFLLDRSKDSGNS
jgi:APA family basic amino acid/polyamine antiporter